MAPEASAPAAAPGPGADRPALDDDLAALAAVLEEIACYDREIAELNGSRRQALERREQLNLRLAPYFRGLPQPSVVAARGGSLYCLHQGSVLPLPRFSAEAAQALVSGPVSVRGRLPTPDRRPTAFGPDGPRHGDRQDVPPAAEACTDLDALDDEVS